jgi:cysteine-rich repeat protein
MAPGTYYLLVNGFGTTAYNYSLQVRYTALCGNGVIEGSEQCDGGPLCGTDCNLLPVCGNGILQAGEQCDDGNAVSGDGCSSTCQWETVTEIEANDTTAAADANAVTNPLLLIDGNRNILGGISASTDKDIFKMVIAANNTVVHLETFDSSGVDCRAAAPYNMSGHNLRILNSAGTAIVTDYLSTSATGYTSANTANSGIGTCAALSYRLDAGTYYVQLDKTAALANYFLQVRFPANDGNEVEPNDVYTTATAAPGRTFSIFGDHTVTTDTDFYAVTVPAGGSIRAETIEGDTSETCESLNLDSEMALYGPTGALISSTGGDAGRGYCSMFDGTGSTPLNSFAHNLAAGTYYIRIISFGTTVADSNQFKYRLVVNVSF